MYLHSVFDLFTRYLVEQQGADLTAEGIVTWPESSPYTASGLHPSRDTSAYFSAEAALFYKVRNTLRFLALTMFVIGSFMWRY